MKNNKLTTFLLALCLAAQLNICSAEKNYDEEITLPLGTNFDLEMEEVTRYEYDGNFVKIQTVNGKDQFILQKTGDTIITVVMEENGKKTELKVLVHIVTEQQFNELSDNDDPAAKPATATTAPAAKPATATTAPAAKPATATTAPAAKPATATTAPAAKPATATTTPAAKSPATATTPAAKPPATTTPAPVLTAVRTGQTMTRSTRQPQTHNEAVQYQAEQYAFDVLDLINMERGKQKLRPLSMPRDLFNEAKLRSKEIANRFSHIRPDGTKFSTVMSNPGALQAENMAGGQTSPAAVVKAWMASSINRTNILNPNFTELGVGYHATTTGGYASYWILLLRG